MNLSRLNNKISSGKIGIAGEYFVAGELTKMGYVASITLRNTKGVDILVSNETGSKTRAIQVKSSMKKSNKWILNKKAEVEFNSNLFYVFVNIKEEKQRPDYFIVPSKVVAEYVKKNHQDWLTGKSKNGKQRKDSDIRNFEDSNNKYLERWDLLKID